MLVPNTCVNRPQSVIMFSTSSSPEFSKMGGQPSRTGSQGQSERSLEQFPELSDVPCYTCRRRHVKCDKILPHCAKCAKKGVPCSGYRKPLRWAEGVAVRGKFKGKTEPVVDDEAVSTARGTIDVASVSVQQEAHFFGLHAFGHTRADSLTTDNPCLELVTYYNSVISGLHSQPRTSLSQAWKIEPITPKALHELPRDILNCLLGISAVHMAARSPGNRAIERLALETKVNLFQGINNLFQLPRNQRADVLFVCINLLFAMDSIEHGVSCWQTHALGAIKFLGSSEGLENLITHYPHLKYTISCLLRFDSLYPILAPISPKWPKVYSRSWLRAICFDTGVQKHSFPACPLSLMRALHDMANCAQNLVRHQGVVSAADTYTREWILSDVLLFQPNDAVQDLSTMYCRALSRTEAEHWKLVYTAWRAAIAVVVIRHLFFGITEPSYFTHPSRSTTPVPPNQQMFQEKPLDLQQDFDILEVAYPFSTDIDPYTSQGHLCPELEQSSYQTSPIPSPHHSSNSITFDFFHRRYEIHNNVFSELFVSLSNLLEQEGISYLRYALLPLLVLGLVSRPHSAERNLSLDALGKFSQTVSDEGRNFSPIGGPELPFDIPWERLDAYTAEEGEKWQNFSASAVPQLHGSSMEWNWVFMLQQLELNLMWPLCSGAAQQELGSEFWAFNVLSNCCNEECFTAFMQPQSSSSQTVASV